LGYDIAQFGARLPANFSGVMKLLLGVRFPEEAIFFSPTTF